MPTRRPKYSKEEFARRGDVIYDRDIAPQVTPGQEGQFVAIDIETGDFEINPNEMTACDRLSERQPDAQIWLKRVGSRFVRHFGGRTVSP